MVQIKDAYIKGTRNNETFQRNSLGVFPKEWKLKKLSDVGKISSGVTPLRSNEEFFGGKIPWVKTTDLNNSFILDTEEKITELALKETSLKMVQSNSILVAMYGGFNQIGRTGLMKINGTTNQALSSFYVDEKEFHSEYILHWLNSFRGYWKRLAGSSRKDPNITKKDVESFPIMQPVYKEQKKIASVLSTWDKAIELKGNLIKQKKEQKKGLIQRLLTGKVRLPGWEGKVKQVKLKGFIKEVKERNKENKVKRILSVTNSRGFINQSDQFGRQIASEDLTSYKVVKNGQFAYNPSRVNVGSIDLLNQFDEGLLSPMYVIFETRQDKLLPEYIYHFLKSNLFLNQMGNLLQGSVRQSLSYDGLEEIKLFIPNDLNEQREISQILTLLDKEINLLQRELEELNNQKIGLMQLLLTGKVRVKV